MLDALIVAARDKAGRAIQAARDLGQSIREKQAKNEAVADVEPQFEKAQKDAADSVKDLNRLLAEQELEKQAKMLTEPVRVPAIKGDGDPAPETQRATTRARRLETQAFRKEQEKFGRAGVRTVADFDRFKQAHAEAFTPFVTEGAAAAMRVLESHGFKPMEAFALLTTAGDLGGYLVPDEFRAEVLRDLAGFAVMRPMCRVEPTGSQALVFPSIQSAASDADIYSTGYTGSWKAEGYVTGGTAPTVQNQPKFGQTRIPVHVWAPDAVEITQELLQDNRADLEGMMAEVIAETLALDEDSAFLNGSGVGRPLGLLNTVSGLSITAVNTGHATQLTYDGLIDLFANLPSQYRGNARWLMSSLTFGAILKLKDGNGMPLFSVNQTPGQFWGKPIAFSEFMPEIAAAANPIIFGDFRYYGIADRQELRVQRLAERYAPNVGLLPTARAGGQPLRTAAFRKQAVSA